MKKLFAVLLAIAMLASFAACSASKPASDVSADSATPTIDKIKEAGYDVTTPLIVTNSDDYRDVKILHEGMVTPEDKVLEIVKE